VAYLFVEPIVPIIPHYMLVIG